MSKSSLSKSNREIQLENFAADLSDVAYRVALQHGLGDKWLELEVDLWGAMTEAIEQRPVLSSDQTRLMGDASAVDD